MQDDELNETQRALFKKVSEMHHASLELFCVQGDRITATENTCLALSEAIRSSDHAATSTFRLYNEDIVALEHADMMFGKELDAQSASTTKRIDDLCERVGQLVIAVERLQRDRDQKLV